MTEIRYESLTPFTIIETNPTKIQNWIDWHQMILKKSLESSTTTMELSLEVDTHLG